MHGENKCCEEKKKKDKGICDNDNASECSCQEKEVSTYNIPKMRQGPQRRDVTSGEQHSVKILREVQNDDSLIVRCANNPVDIKLDVKYIAQMVLLVLLHKPPSPEVPHLDGLIVTRADEAPRSGIECKRTHECVVPNECAYTFACRCIPHFDLTVARAGHDVIVLEFNACEPAIVPVESAQTGAALDVPQHHLCVPAGAYDVPVL